MSAGRAQARQRLSREQMLVAARDRAAMLAVLDEAIRLFTSKRLALSSQFAAVDILREDGIYQIVIEDLKEIRARHAKATGDGT